ncbi:hypothetical protein AX16_003433 [Volvariella volvacea WC 439]|nr:hypothetical protein AX16_003433 [Volvariella volvacea WC 439]
MLGALDLAVSLICLAASLFLYRTKARRHAKEAHAQPHGYVLLNQVTHTRLLPTAASHSFTYPTLALLLPLRALENHELDLGHGFVFGYNRLWSSITCLRPNPYLFPRSMGKAKQPTIASKLEDLLEERGYLSDGTRLLDTWIMTMPSFLGFEGINPLTVYFVYRYGDEKLWLVVLEIHNTFGEIHVHVLQTGIDEDYRPSMGSYDHQWTFPRDFHVSPFNDRTGFYRVSIRAPTHPPSYSENQRRSPVISPPKPSIRVHLHTEADEDSDETPSPQIGHLKLIALLRGVSSMSFTTSSLLLALVRTPFVLLLSMVRILYQAWILHYIKRMDVFIRPELKPVYRPSPEDGQRRSSSGAVKWLPAVSVTSYLVLYVLLFLAKLERWVFQLARARIVPGDEPWSEWERARQLFEAGLEREKKTREEWKEVRGVEFGSRREM